MDVEARLRAFAAVARKGSFSRAAEALYVSQPAVSKHVASLEAELGTQLVVRGRPGAVLTPAGQVLADYVLRAQALLANARRALAAGADADIGTLALAASGIPGTYLVPEIVARFHERYPGVHLDFQVSTSAGTLELVRAHDVEIGIVGGMTLPPELEAESLLEDEVVLVGPPSLAGRRLRPRDLEGWAWISREDGSATKASVEAARWQMGLHEVRTLDLPSWEAVKLAVASGAGIAAISRVALRLELETSSLALLDVPGWRLSRTIAAVTAKNVPLTPPAAKFLELLRARFAVTDELPPNSNLPAEPTPLVGRRAELEDVATALERSRIVTLTGPGGCGKTRIAKAAAARQVDRFHDGVYLVDLSAIREPERVLDSVADTIGCADRAALSEQLPERSTLLVLDNFEQVLDAAPDIGRLMATAPRCNALVTSRARLRLRGERVVEIPPLPTGDAVSLFVQVGSDVRPGLKAGPEIAEICERLDGLPLAVELAAARSNVLSSSELLARLDRDLAVLVSAGRDVAARHRTLRATIQWSANLLSDDARALFQRLAVFAGGWSLDAVEPVCAGTLEGLMELVEQSLVRRDGDRFTMLDTIHQHAQELLEAGGDADDTRRRHANYFAELAQTADAELSGSRHTEWTQRLRDESENVRAAVGWANARGEHALQLKIAGAAWQMWIGMSGRDEWRAWLEQALDYVDDARLRLLALAPLSWMAFHAGGHDTAAAHAEERARLAKLVGADDHLAGALSLLSAVADARGDVARALELGEEAVEIARCSDDPASLPTKLHNLAAVYMQSGDLVAARSRFNEARTIATARGNDFLLSESNVGIASIELLEKNGTGALALMRDALPLEAASRPDAVWFVLELAGAALIATTRYAAGVRILAAAEAERERAGGERDAFQANLRAGALSAAASTLGKRTFASAEDSGRALKADDAVELVLSERDG
jgi:DNA-binding transcriptional LysR family regulator/predicted ATPase